MSPWTALLESLHSALIDELTERHPEPKPELGLPSRHSSFTLPKESPPEILFCEVDQEPGGKGTVLLALDLGCSKTLKLSAEELWKAILKRAGSEFMRRQIKPKLGRVTLAAAGPALPAGYNEPQRLVWIPFRLPAGRIYLGMGV